MTPHEISIRSVGDVCVVSLVQDVDTAVAGAIEAEIFARTSPSVPLVVDLTKVSFLDSAGVRLLDRLVGRQRSALVVVSPPGTAPRFALRVSAFPSSYLASSVSEALALALSP